MYATNATSGVLSPRYLPKLRGTMVANSIQ